MVPELRPGDRRRMPTSRPARFGHFGDDRDEGGYVQPTRYGAPGDPSEQGLGYPERIEDERYSRGEFDRSDGDPDDEPLGILEHQHGEPQDYYLAADSNGDIGIFRHGGDQPVGILRGSPGLAARDCRIVRDRRSGRLLITRRRHRDRLHALVHEQDRLGRGRSRDSAGRERALLQVQNDLHRQFWARPQASDFWGRRS
jgi:hypothetical protein